MVDLTHLAYMRRTHWHDHEIDARTYMCVARAQASARFASGFMYDSCVRFCSPWRLSAAVALGLSSVVAAVHADEPRVAGPRLATTPSAATLRATPPAPRPASPPAVSCEPDTALTDAAGELLLTGQAPAPAQLMAAVRAAGSEAVAPRALYLPSDDPAHVTQWLADMRAKNDVDLICGDARSERARLVLASARAATLVVDRRLLRGTLVAGFERPELILRRSDGTFTRVAVKREELERGIPIDPEWQATQIQLLAWGPSGPRPVAERTLGREGSAERSEQLSLSSESPLDANGVADVLAQLRARHGRPTLRHNRLADGVATAHAKAVCAQGRVVHELEPGVSPETRIARAGLKAQLTGETVARAVDANAALQALWQSPSHSLTLLERRFTDVGVGLATDEQKRTCLVVLLMAWPRPVPRAAQAAKH